MQFSILYVVTMAAAAMAATGEMSSFEKRQIRNSVNAAVMSDANGNVKAFDTDGVYLPSQPQRRSTKKITKKF